MIVGAAHRSHEDLADFAIQILKRADILEQSGTEADWSAYVEAQRKIEAFVVPWTTVTSLMRRFFYALSAAVLPERIVGAGTYAGFGFAWFVMGQAKGTKVTRLAEAVGLDVNAQATTLARQNTAALGLGERLRFEQADAAAWLRASRTPISLLYIDIESADTGKSGYAEVFQAARPRLVSGALIVAHDACVPMFSEDFAHFHLAITSDPCLRGPVILPLDECGVSVSRVV